MALSLVWNSLEWVSRPPSSSANWPAFCSRPAATCGSMFTSSGAWSGSTLATGAGGVSGTSSVLVAGAAGAAGAASGAASGGGAAVLSSVLILPPFLAVLFLLLVRRLDPLDHVLERLVRRRIDGVDDRVGDV